MYSCIAEKNDENRRKLVETLLPAVGQGFELVDLSQPPCDAMIPKVKQNRDPLTMPFPMVTDDVRKSLTSIQRVLQKIN